MINTRLVKNFISSSDNQRNKPMIIVKCIECLKKDYKKDKNLIFFSFFDFEIAFLLSCTTPGVSLGNSVG